MSGIFWKNKRGWNWIMWGYVRHFGKNKGQLCKLTGQGWTKVKDDPKSRIRGIFVIERLKVAVKLKSIEARAFS